MHSEPKRALDLHLKKLQVITSTPYKREAARLNGVQRRRPSACQHQLLHGTACLSAIQSRIMIQVIFGSPWQKIFYAPRFVSGRPQLSFLLHAQVSVVILWLWE